MDAVTHTVTRVGAGRGGMGPIFYVLWRVGKQGDFIFNLCLKFAPTGSRTQDVRSAIEAT